MTNTRTGEQNLKGGGIYTTPNFKRKIVTVFSNFPKEKPRSQLLNQSLTLLTIKPGALGRMCH